MKKIILPSLLLTTMLLQSCSDNKNTVITDEAELRTTTDTYRSNSKRPKDFISQGNGTVIDKRTGLQWMRCSLGQKWTKNTFRGQ
ncbi:MAG: hypothetical protein KGV50_07270 [Gammaproteobacteria bacterium]|nr:hypothetical protein [Gammaproteobacteria bacterium]